MRMVAVMWNLDPCTRCRVDEVRPLRHAHLLPVDSNGDKLRSSAHDCHIATSPETLRISSAVPLRMSRSISLIASPLGHRSVDPPLEFFRKFFHETLHGSDERFAERANRVP